MNKYAIVLAAGKGTRMRDPNPNRSKVSHEILGKPLVNYVLDAIQPLGLSKIVTIVGHAGEHTSQLVKDYSEIAWQREQKGTGHAVLQAEPLLGGLEGATVILCGDAPLIKTSTLKSLFNKHIKEGNDVTVLGARVKNPHGYGRLVVENGQLTKIVEQKNCNETEDKINLVNTGVIVFNNKVMFEELKVLEPNPVTNEYYITTLIETIRDKGGKVGAYDKCGAREMKGINDPEQLCEAEAELVRRNKISASLRRK